MGKDHYEIIVDQMYADKAALVLAEECRKKDRAIKILKDTLEAISKLILTEGMTKKLMEEFKEKEGKDG